MRNYLKKFLQQHSRWTYIWWSTNILKVHGIHSISILWVNIVICIWSLIFFCLVMSENFRKTCLQYYKRDPCHYFTSPGLSWDAVFKMTDIKLEFKTDIDIDCYEKGMCGGITHFQPTCKSKQQIHEQPQCWRTIKIYRVWMPIICMDGQWVNIFQLVLLNDWVKKKFNMQT